MIGIYKITNPKGKIYVGQSIDIKYRFYRYKKLSCKEQPRIYRSLVKYGADNHKFEIITECLETELDKLEIYYIELYNTLERKSGLNCKTGGANGRHSDETKAKISITSANCSAETRAKISNANKGKKKPAGFGAIISKRMSGIPKSDITKQRISESKKGTVTSEKTKELLRKIGLSNPTNFILRYGEDHHNTKLILNMETGIFYWGIKEASFSVNMNMHTLYCRLVGINKADPKLKIV